jgi:hypothetical protein
MRLNLLRCVKSMLRKDSVEVFVNPLMHAQVIHLITKNEDTKHNLYTI